MFNPRIDMLPPAQRLLWNELNQTPRYFVLYGGTAMALRLAHRQSIDFDFFTNEAFEPSTLLQSVGYLKAARVDKRGDNTLSVVVERKGPVKISFFGDVRMNHVEEPDLVLGDQLQIASMLDLTATKLKTIQQRAEAKDYHDIAAALDAGVSLAHALRAATAVFGKVFNIMSALKALTYFGDGNLASLPRNLQDSLRRSAEEIKLDGLPSIVSKSGITRREFRK